MMKRKAIKRMVKKRIAEAIEQYEKSKANPCDASWSGSINTGRSVNVQGCIHKTFMNGKPYPFKGTEGVVGLRRWIEKVEQVFEIFKCAEEDKVMFAASTFEGRALTRWNGNVHTLGLVNANRIPWTEFKLMITTGYCPVTKIQRMEEELWTLTLKGDDIEAYNNHFYELALMCKAHHQQGPCPPKSSRCNKLGHQEKDCRVRIPATGGNSLQDVTCFGCGEKGHYRHTRPKGKNQ
nr:hypothetical protein [Tanacetum cinerariifolium]